MAPDFRASVELRASISPSEDPEKVARAVSNVAGGSEGRWLRDATEVSCSFDDSRSLGHLRDQLRDRKVRGAARRLLVDGRRGDVTEIMLNRQAAYAGAVVLCGAPEESPLGPIYLRVESDQLDALIDWLTVYEGG